MHPTSPASNRPLWSFSALAITALLSACAGTPAATTPKADSPLPQTVAANPPGANNNQRSDTKLNVQFDWWKLLQSTQLNALIEQSFAAYPTVDSAQNALLKVQQSGIVQFGYFHFATSVSTGNLVSLQDFPNPPTEKFIGDSYYGLHAQQLIVSYLPEALHISAVSLPKSEAEMKRLQLEATYRTLADNLIACMLQEASLRAQMNTARKIVAIDQSLLAILRKQLKAGLVTQADVASQQTSVARSEQALLPIKKQFEQTRELLHLLLGIAPEADLPQTIDLATPNLHQELPLEVPAALIDQRPDVRAAQLAMPSSNVQYQATMSVALKDTEGTLLAIYNDTLALKAATVAEQESAATLESIRKRYSAAAANYQDVIAAERNLQLARLRLTQTRTQHLGDAVALYHALGGAWWNDAVKLEIDRDLTKR